MHNRLGDEAVAAHLQLQLLPALRLSVRPDEEDLGCSFRSAGHQWICEFPSHPFVRQTDLYAKTEVRQDKIYGRALSACAGGISCRIFGKRRKLLATTTHQWSKSGLGKKVRSSRSIGWFRVSSSSFTNPRCLLPHLLLDPIVTKSCMSSHQGTVFFCRPSLPCSRNTANEKGSA